MEGLSDTTRPLPNFRSKTITIGVDVGVWQGELCWERAAAQLSGVSAALMDGDYWG